MILGKSYYGNIVTDKIYLGSNLIHQLTPSASIVTDSFNRADSATLGVADTGEVWNSNAYAVGVFGISSNQAYLSTPNANSYAVLETGMTNISIKCTAVYSGTGEWGLVARWEDSNNFLKINFVSNYWIYIRTRIAGVETNITSSGFNQLPNGTVVRVDIVGDAVQVYLNDVLRATGDLAGSLTTGTQAGLASNATTGNYWEDFSVTEII